MSVVVVSRGPSLTLARTLRSLGRADGVERAELLLGLDGWTADPTLRQALRRWLPRTPTHVVELAKATPGGNRNALVRRAAGELVVFVDDDVEVPSGFLAAAHAELRANDGVGVLGGPNLTPPSSTPFQQLAGRVLASSIGAGPVRHRYRIREPGPASERSLTLCNLVIRRKELGDAPFDAELACAEENELLLRLARRGVAMRTTPELAVYHHRRDRLSRHTKQMVKYGFGRGQLLVRAFYAKQATYVVPAAALLLLAVGLFFAPYAALIALAAYAALLLVGAATLGTRRLPQAAALLAATHLGYAVGVLSGLAYEAQRLQRRVLRASEGRFGRDAAAMLVALCLAIAGGVASGVLVSRTFGPQGRGTFELARTIASVMGGIAGLGLGRAAVFLRPRKQITDGEIFGVVAGSTALGAAMAVAAALVLVRTSWLSLTPRQALVVCASIPLITFFFQSQAALQGVAPPAWFRRTLALRDVLFLGVLGAALAIDRTMSAVLLVWTLHWLVSGAVMAVLLAKRCGRPRLPRGTWGRLGSVGVSQLLLGLLVGAHLRLDVPILDALRGTHAVGEYAVATGAAEPITYGGIAVAMALYPRSAVSSAANIAGGAVRTARALRAVLCLTLVGAAALWVVGPRLIVAVFGPDFHEAAKPLRLLLPGIVGMTLFFVLQSDLAGRGRRWTIAISSVGAVAANVGLNLLLIPRFGASGAAFASTVTYWVGAVLLLTLFSRCTGVPIRRCLVPSTRDARKVAAAFFGRRRDALAVR